MIKDIIKELLKEELEGKKTSENQTVEYDNQNLQSIVLGEYVIVRSRNEGVNAGYVVRADETGVVLREARRLWYHKPIKKEVSWYEGLSQFGISEDSKVSCKVKLKVIVEDYSMVLCSDIAKKSIEELKSNPQS